MMIGLRDTTTLVFCALLASACSQQSAPTDATPAGEPQLSNIANPITDGNGFGTSTPTPTSVTTVADVSLDFTGRYVSGQTELTWNNTVAAGLSAYNLRRSMSPITDFRSGTEIYRGRDLAYLDASTPIAEAVHYRLFFELKNGDIVPSDALTVRTLTTVNDASPTAIVNVVAQNRGDYLDLRWLNPADTDLRSIEIYREASPFTTLDNLTPLASVTASQDYYSDTTVVSGNQYTYGFSAIDALDQRSPLTTLAVTFVDTLAPGEPQQLEARVTASSVQLTWIAPVGESVSRYLVARHPNHYPSLDEVNNASVVSNTTTDTFLNDADLSQIDYYYSVFAQDAQGNTSTRAVIRATPTTAVYPESPTGFQTISGAAEGSVNLVWDDASGFADSLVMVVSQLGFRNTLTNVEPENRINLAATSTSRNYSATHQNELYFSLFAIKNGIESAIPAKVKGRTADLTPPPGASSFGAQNSTAGVRLDWTLPNDSDISDVIIQWSNSAPPATIDDGQRLTKTSANVTSIYHFGAQPNTPFYYRLFTADTYANVDNSAALSASITTPASKNIETLNNVQAAPADGSVEVSWQALSKSSLEIYYHVSTDPNYLATNVGATPTILPGSQRSFTLPGLINGVQQNIWLATYDGQVLSDYIHLQVTPQDNLAPLQIQDARAEGFESSVRLTWKENNLTDASLVRIRMSSSFAPSNSGQGIKIYDHPPGSIPAFSQEGLAENEGYYFSFFTTDSTGNDSLPVTVFARTQDTIKPMAPTNLVLRPGEDEISLYWDLPQPSDEVIQTKLVRSLNPIVLSSDHDPVFLPANERFYSDTTVTNNVPYFYGVYFLDASGNESLPAFKFGQSQDLTAPGVTANLLAFADDQRVDLVWTNPLDGDFAKTIIGYTLGDLPAASIEGLTASNEVIAPATSTTFTGLDNGQLYTFSAFALDTSGNYENYATRAAIPTTTDPAPDAISFTASFGENAIRLDWNNPTTNIDDTIILRSTLNSADALANGTQVSGDAFLPVTNSFVDTGLVNGTTYFYALYNRNNNGNSAVINTSATPQDATPPASITGLQVTAQDEQITFTWVDPTPAENDLQDIIIRRRTDDFPTDITDGTPLAGSPVSKNVQTITDTGLTNGDIYYYSFFARDTSALISSRVTTGASPIDTTAPAIVTSAAVANGNAQVTLTWTNPTDPDLNRIVIRKSTLSYPVTYQSGLSVASLDDGGGSIPTSYTDNGLVNQDDYYYSLFALDANNNASAAVNLLGQPLDIDPPPSVSLSTVEELDQQIDFIWNNPATADFNRVKLLRRSDIFPTDAFDASATLVYEGTSTSVSDTTGLVNGTSYRYRFFSLDTFDNASSLDVIATPQDLTPPGSITGLVVTPGDEQVSFSWTNPIDSDVDAIIIRRRGDDFPTSISDGTSVGGDLAPGTVTIVDNDITLVNDTTYYYSFFVRDNAGLISNRVTTTAIPVDTTPPGPVTGVGAVSSEGLATLTWTNPTDSDLQKIVVRRSKIAFPATAFSDFSAASLDNGGGTIPQTYTDINLDDGDTYYYSLFAVDNRGNVSTAAQVNAYPVDVTAPVSVFNINAVALDQQIDFTWSVPPDPDFANVLILRRSDTFPTDIADASATVIYQGSAAAYSDTNALVNNTFYYYRFFSLDDFDNASSADITATPIDLTPPSLVSCSACIAGDERVTLTWNNPPEPDTVAVHIRRGTTTYPAALTDGTVITSIAMPGNTFTNTGLTNLQPYRYSIFSEDNVGNVSAAYQVPILTPQDTIAPSPVSPLAVTNTNLRITLSWTNPGDDSMTLYIRRAVGGYPVNKSDGDDIATVAVVGATGSYTDFSVSAGTPYSYSLFTEDEVGNVSAAAQVTGTPIDLTPPANVTSLAIFGGDYETNLSWMNPTVTDFSQVRIYRRTNAAPTATGTYLLTTLTGGEATFNDTGLSAHTLYYYLVVAGDTSNNLASGAATNVYTDYATIADATVTFSMEKDSGHYFCWTTSSSAHFNHVEIRTQATTAPATKTDGSLIHTGVYAGGAEECYRHSGTTNGVTQGYTIFTVEDDNEYTSGTNFVLTSLASGELEHFGPIDFADSKTGIAAKLENYGNRDFVGAYNSTLDPQANLVRIDIDGNLLSNISNGSAPTLYRMNDISRYSSYWYGAGSANDTNLDLSVWRFNSSATTWYNTTRYDTGAFNDDDEALNMVTYAGNYFSSGYREVAGVPYPIVWSLDSSGYVRASFYSGSWTVPTANAQGSVVDHIYTSNGYHLLAIESSLGDSLISASLSTTTATLNTGFDADGELDLPDAEVTAISRNYNGETYVPFPIYVSTVTAGGDVKIYAIDANGSPTAAFGGNITLNEVNPIRIESMVKESDGTLHAIGSVDNTGDRDIMYWRIATDGTVEVTKQFVDGTFGSLGHEDQWPVSLILEPITSQPMFLGTGYDGGTGYEILFGRIAND